MNLMKPLIIQQLVTNRYRLQYRYFFNAGIDKVTGICDGEGSDILYLEPDGNERYIGSLYGYTPSDVVRLSDEEFKEALDISFIAASPVD